MGTSVPTTRTGLRASTGRSTDACTAGKVLTYHLRRSPGEARKGEREIYVPEEEGFLTVPVYDRYLLGTSATFEGPAVVEERESTAVIGPESRAEIDGARNLLVRWSE